MDQRLANLSDDQIAFLCDECDLTEKELYSLDEDAILEVYDRMSDIEAAAPGGIAGEIIAIMDEEFEESSLD